MTMIKYLIQRIAKGKLDSFFPTKLRYCLLQYDFDRHVSWLTKHFKIKTKLSFWVQAAAQRHVNSIVSSVRESSVGAKPKVIGKHIHNGWKDSGYACCSNPQCYTWFFWFALMHFTRCVAPTELSSIITSLLLTCRCSAAWVPCMTNHFQSIAIKSVFKRCLSTSLRMVCCLVNV